MINYSTNDNFTAKGLWLEVINFLEMKRRLMLPRKSNFVQNYNINNLEMNRCQNR